jgi:catalase
VSAFSFELSHCDDPVVYRSMSVRLSKIDDELARTSTSSHCRKLRH